MNETDLLARIAINPKIMVGKTVIAGTRIPVELILKMLSQGIPEQAILDEYPNLQQADIRAALAYAARSITFEEIEPITA